jgi:hypothetical protein
MELDQERKGEFKKWQKLLIKNAGFVVPLGKNFFLKEKDVLQSVRLIDAEQFHLVSMVPKEKERCPNMDFIWRKQ